MSGESIQQLVANSTAAALASTAGVESIASGMAAATAMFMSSGVGSYAINDSCVSNCTNMPSDDVFYFTPGERSILWATTIVGACLSIIGTTLITLSYVIYPSLRTLPFKLIVLLSLSDLISSVSYLIPTGGRDPVEQPGGGWVPPSLTTSCIVQASMSQFGAVAAFLWTAVFSFNIYFVLVQKRSNVAKFEPYYHLVCWGVPALLLAVNLLMSSFGPTLVWCWIDSSYNDLRLGTFYAPLIAIFITNLIFYCLIGRSLKSMGEDKQSAINSRLRQYLLIFFFVRVWSIINRLQNWIQPGQPVFWLYFMHAACSTLQGFCNSVVYGLNVRVRAHYSALCCCQDRHGDRLVSASVESSIDHRSQEARPYNGNVISGFPHYPTGMISPNSMHRYHSMKDDQGD